ncbi:MAG TPA: hypothetical protein VES73_13410 [Lamprocystis sp. (in: g-proteobacteria)]|nr:hypothetical protein [Lamprocystis sp. (in: g-proteobacteria)]
MMDLTARWASLSPNVQRAVAWGAGIALLLGVAAIAVQTAAPRQPAASPQEKLVRNLLTDTDPRSLGIEGLAARLERMERHLDAVAQQAAKAAATPPEAAAFNDTVDGPRRQEIDTLKVQLDELQRQVTAAKHTAPPTPPPPARSAARIKEPTPGLIRIRAKISNLALSLPGRQCKALKEKT